MADQFKYAVFVSYSHADSRWARWLHGKLEAFRRPDASGRFGNADRPLAPSFIDRSEFATSADLPATTERALRDSRALVVICSPRSARSRWVDKEIRFFKQLGRSDRIFPLIVEGEPFAEDPAHECFPRSLKHRVDETGAIRDEITEPLAADVRPHADGRNAAALKIIAGLLETPFDELNRREHARKQRRMALATAAAGTLAVVMTLLAATAYYAREEADLRRGQAENLIGFMLGDLRARLEPLGRLDVLEEVSDEAMKYLASLPDDELEAGAVIPRAMALRQIGEVRKAQGHVEPARESFLESRRLLLSALDAQPDNEKVKFELSQAHFWVADIYYQKNDFATAKREIQRYQELASSLVQSNPDSRQYRMEEVYAVSNLATLSFNMGTFEEARAGFERTAGLVQDLLRTYPGDRSLKSELAGTYSWLASTHAQLHNLAASLSIREKELELMRASASDRDKISVRRLTDTLSLVAAERYRLGDLEGADELVSEAKAQLVALVSHDKSNVIWRARLASARSDLARNHIAAVRLDLAREELALAEAELRRQRTSGNSADLQDKWWKNELLQANHLRMSGAHADAVVRLESIIESLDPTNLEQRSARSDHHFAAAAYLLAQTRLEMGDDQAEKLTAEVLRRFDPAAVGIDLFATLYALAVVSGSASDDALSHLLDVGYVQPVFWTHTPAARNLVERVSSDSPNAGHTRSASRAN